MSDDAARAETEEPAAPKRRGRSSRKNTVGRVLLASAIVLALATGLGVVYLYRHLNGNLDVVDVTGQLGSDRPDKEEVAGPQEPLNILVMGSDDRDAAGNNIDNQELGSTDRSDTTILMHLSADRKRAYGVSIPRDSLVTRPTCKTEDGESIPGGTDVMWNEAFALGGPACTIRQFEKMTGVFVDHYVVIDFAGFEGMVNAIDGVPVCIPEPIVDPAHGINIEKGTREVEGREALNYVRARYTLGDGSDISRIKRQQAFIAAMANKVISAGTLARVDRLVGFLNAATESLQVDPGSTTSSRSPRWGSASRASAWRTSSSSPCRSSTTSGPSTAAGLPGCPSSRRICGKRSPMTNRSPSGSPATRSMPRSRPAPRRNPARGRFRRRRPRKRKRTASAHERPQGRVGRGAPPTDRSGVRRGSSRHHLRRAGRRRPGRPRRRRQLATRAGTAAPRLSLRQVVRRQVRAWSRSGCWPAGRGSA
jgi:LCP family protein required for cell wall assembly